MRGNKISDYLPQTEILAQLAEEASELAQAALKLRRAMDGTNPTPKSVEECRESLCEEYADVFVCMNALMENDFDKFATETSILVGEKNERWLNRLKERENAPTTGPESLRTVAHWEESVCFDDVLWVCPNCKFPSESIAAPRLYHYCPNCGTKIMEEGIK